MANLKIEKAGWFPLQGSWQEIILSWDEQIELGLVHPEEAPLMLYGNGSKEFSLLTEPDDALDI